MTVINNYSVPALWRHSHDLIIPEFLEYTTESFIKMVQIH